MTLAASAKHVRACRNPWGHSGLAGDRLVVVDRFPSAAAPLLPQIVSTDAAPGLAAEAAPGLPPKGPSRAAWTLPRKSGNT